MRRALALLLIPSLALGAEDAPRAAELSPQYAAMKQIELFDTYEQLQSRRPGFGAAIGVASGGLALTTLGALITQARYTSTVNGKTMSGSGNGPVAWAIIGVGVAVFVGGLAWLVINVTRRARIDTELKAVTAELDAREAKAARASEASPALLALLAAPVAAQRGGSVVVMVTDEGGRPVTTAAVTRGNEVVTCDASGAASIDDLPAGPTPLVIAAEGYEPADETAMVVLGARVPLRVTLKNAGARLARLTGVVRSRVDGGALTAELEVAQTHARVRADAEGVFSLDLPAGSYTVRISAPGYVPQTKQLKVKAGDRAIFNVGLYAQ